MATAPSSNFDTFVYERPDLSALKTDFYAALDQFKSASTVNEARQALLQIDHTRGAISTMANLAHIRYTINTKDPFYAAEKQWGDQHYPTTESWKKDYYEAVLESPHRPALEAEFGPQFFRIASLSLLTFKSEILPMLQQENKLSSEYVQIKAGAEIELNGETYNLSSIRAKEVDSDRELRKKATILKSKWFAERAESFDRIFDELVSTRNNAAKTLGYDTFIELGYDRMLRTDYNAEKVAQFRQKVVEHIVPLASQLYEKQRERLGVDKLRYFDEGFRFPDGNPKPQGPPDWILDQARSMYDHLSPETKDFYRSLEARNLMDVVAKEGKATGGYCTYIVGEGAPFIFSNFNGTSGDIDVLTHELGHAFQVHCSSHLQPQEYNWPTYEACEIHSMSMEFFTYPWMEKFFGPDTEKYYFSHLAGAIRFLPYGCAVDEFQHLVYAKPTMTIAERHAAWKAVEAKYLPHRDYEGTPLLEGGTFWHQQNHIFSVPFYYIDYCLAQICAFQFWEKDRQDHQSTWADYLRLCQAGGSHSFLELVELAGLESPFADGVVERMATIVGKELSTRTLFS